jgi:hypothetical protein
MRGVERLATVRRYFQTEAIDVCSLNVVGVFYSMYFGSCFVKAMQLVGKWHEIGKAH